VDHLRRPPLRRSLAQHHLRSGGTCRPLLDFLAPEPGARILEVGPGGGVLTRELLAAGARVTAVEIDLDWAAALRDKAPRMDLTIAVADALELDWGRLSREWKVAGNLPYNVGTVIVERFLRGAPAGIRAAFLLQREVVDRMTAAPGSDAYGALSVLVAARARSWRLGVVRPGAFVPPPKVDSAFVGLETALPLLAEERMLELEATVRAAFGQRRKSLRNSLASVYGRSATESALARLGVDGARRAETLSLEEFVTLSAALVRPE